MAEELENSGSIPLTSTDGANPSIIQEQVANDSVQKWFSYGLNVLPTRDKKPLIGSWKEWQYKRQTKKT
jgi:hypothetical protein